MVFFLFYFCPLQGWLGRGGLAGASSGGHGLQPSSSGTCCLPQPRGRPEQPEGRGAAMAGRGSGPAGADVGSPGLRAQHAGGGRGAWAGRAAAQPRRRRARPMSAAGAGSAAAPPVLRLAGGAGQPTAARAEQPGGSGGEHGSRFLCGAHGDRTTLKEFGGVWRWATTGTEGDGRDPSGGGCWSPALCLCLAGSRPDCGHWAGCSGAIRSSSRLPAPRSAARRGSAAHRRREGSGPSGRSLPEPPEPFPLAGRRLPV